jgi:hypothetical protein
MHQRVKHMQDADDFEGHQQAHSHPCVDLDAVKNHS